MRLSLLSTRLSQPRATETSPRPTRLHIAVAQTGSPGLNIYKLGTKQAHVVSSLQTSSGLWGRRSEPGPQAQPVTAWSGKGTLYPGGSSPHSPQALCIFTFILEARSVHPPSSGTLGWSLEMPSPPRAPSPTLSIAPLPLFYYFLLCSSQAFTAEEPPCPSVETAEAQP